MRALAWATASSAMSSAARVLIHLVDGTAENVGEAYKTVRDELAAYSPALLDKPEFVGLNKIDAMDAKEIERKARSLSRAMKRTGSKARLFKISGVSGKGLEELLEAAFAMVEARRDEAAAEKAKKNAAAEAELADSVK